jgi:tetratricopeptide (TPR) repeat protein
METQSAAEILREKREALQREWAISSDPAQRFTLKKQIEETEADLATLSGSPPGGADAGMPRVDLSHLPAGAEHFLGRGPELASLDAAWSPGSGIAVVEVIAPGGTGKTALIKRWLEAPRPVGNGAGWGGASQVYGWSFYSQGTTDDREATEDHFLAAAITRFGVKIEASANPADKGQAIADRLCGTRTLLILDGCEPLQYPPGPLARELRAPGLKTLLIQIASAGHPGLCILTSREWLADLGEWVRTPANPRGPVLRLDLGNLADTDGAALLHARGATRAGAATIGPDDPELRDASREFGGHALTLSLLGRYLARAKGGDIRQRDRIAPADTDRAARGHAARVIAAYEAWFARADQRGIAAGARALAALRLLGYFDRPAVPDLLAALRASPPIAGLTEPLQGLGGDAWTLTLADLADCGLVASDPRTGAVDAHPLVREHLAAALAGRDPAAWREGHRRLYARLKGTAPRRPDGLEGLQPLYQAVVHGCRAGLWQEVCDAVYIDRILRGTGHEGFYSIHKLGAFGADLAAIACLFVEPWSPTALGLREGPRAWLLNAAAFSLRALGRLQEALEPMRAAVEMRVNQEAWENAAIVYGSLSELQLTLGRVAEAAEAAARAVEYADRCGDAFQRMSKRTALADALHQRGEVVEARAGFAEAEAMQEEWQPQYPLLYSLPGFRYCDLLLAGAERAAWGAEGGVDGGRVPAWPLGDCESVAGRARQALPIAERNDWLLDIALDHLTLARSVLYGDRLAGRPPGREAADQVGRALDGLRAAGEQEFITQGLLTRAWLRHAQGDPAGAVSDLAEAERIASRGAMQLHLADCALHRARLFRDRAALTQARRLIETCGYGRRLPELEDAEAWLNPTPQGSQSL